MTAESSPAELALALRLPPEVLARQCDSAVLGFATTAELPALRDIIGQPRGVQAIEFGIDMLSPGYNIYVMGARGTGRLTAIERFIQARAAEEPVADDWLYVHNFSTPHQPRALRLPGGSGRPFCEEIRSLITRLRAELSRAFEDRTFIDQANALKHAFSTKRDEIVHELQAKATEQGFIIRTASGAMMLAPVKDGQVMTPEDFEAMTADDRAALEQRHRTLEDAMQDTMRQANDLEEAARSAYQDLVNDTARAILDQAFAGPRDRYADHLDVLTTLEEMQVDIQANIPEFVGSLRPSPSPAPEEVDQPEAMPEQSIDPPDGLRRYEVNLLVDHSDADGAPVVVVALPTYQNLIGRIEHHIQFGALSTDFTMIKAGALHEANGGYLVVRALDILRQPFAWEALKRALQTGQICVEEPESRGISVITAQTLEPAPIPLDLKVIMLGNPLLYYALFDVEEDFPELFKVKADFAAEMDRDADSEALYAAFVATRCHEDDLPHFNAEAVGLVVDYSTWLAGDQQRLSTRFGEITDLIREAAYYARRDGRDLTVGDDVRRAITERRYRNNLMEELSHRRFLDGEILLATEGAEVGQINGLTVIQLGDHAFGQPSRITARVYVGQADVVQIEREVQMTGPIHDKGVLILRGYLGSMYAQDFPLTLSASLTFEQNYGGVEGDSASSTELFALLSALSGLPIRQDLAVTGSVDQRGVIQPIGGVSPKIEGYFAICQARGLTGSQGVIIPRSNVRHLMLDAEVVAAVQAGKFHIYGIETVDQGIELLTGIPAGERDAEGAYPQGSVHQRVQARLRALAEGMRQFSAPTVTVQTDHQSS